MSRYRIILEVEVEEASLNDAETRASSLARYSEEGGATIVLLPVSRP